MRAGPGNRSQRETRSNLNGKLLVPAIRNLLFNTDSLAPQHDQNTLQDDLPVTASAHKVVALDRPLARPVTCEVLEDFKVLGPDCQP